MCPSANNGSVSQLVHQSFTCSKWFINNRFGWILCQNRQTHCSCEQNDNPYSIAFFHIHVSINHYPGVSKSMPIIRLICLQGVTGILSLPVFIVGVRKNRTGLFYDQAARAFTFYIYFVSFNTQDRP